MKKILHQMVAFVGVLILSLGLCVSPIQVYAIEDYYDVNNVPQLFLWTIFPNISLMAKKHSMYLIKS